MYKCKPFRFFNAAVEHAGDSNQSWSSLASPVVTVVDFCSLICSVTPSLLSLSPIRRSCTFKLRTFVTPFDLLNRIEKVGDLEETNPYSSKNTVEHAEVGGGRES
ncbi:hypothetical protein LWI29_017959 [Acer saccharum]|uniref:Uncharacterized protein n=1 Tax=Acer saccharum TaxID=4024 RepID=A0AA39W782_ACESA|nr:hypothetical protein LWI29_017959 [Acer saccharum]